jgi:hypothetical protein
VSLVGVVSLVGLGGILSPEEEFVFFSIITSDGGSVDVVSLVGLGGVLSPEEEFVFFSFISSKGVSEDSLVEMGKSRLDTVSLVEFGEMRNLDSSVVVSKVRKTSLVVGQVVVVLSEARSFALNESDSKESENAENSDGFHF